MLRADLYRSNAQRSLRLGQDVHLFVEVSSEHEFAATAARSDVITPGKTFLCRELNRHDVLCKEEPYELALGAPKIKRKVEELPAALLFVKSIDVPKSLGDLYNRVFCSWDSRLVRAVQPSARGKPPCSVRAHFSVPFDVESSAENVVEASIDEDFTEREVTICFFDAQTYRVERHGSSSFR